MYWLGPLTGKGWRGSLGTPGAPRGRGRASPGRGSRLGNRPHKHPGRPACRVQLSDGESIQGLLSLGRGGSRVKFPGCWHPLPQPGLQFPAPILGGGCSGDSGCKKPEGPMSDTLSPAGMVLAILLYHGHLPRLFQRNLLYGQKNKYRTPKGKPAPGPEGVQTPTEGCRGQEPGQRRARQQPLGSLWSSMWRPGPWLRGTKPAPTASPETIRQ